MLSIIDLNLVKETLISNINQKGLEKSQSIMNELHETDVSSNLAFQRKFKGFYKIRNGDSWCRAYFGYMEKQKYSSFTFEDVISFLYKATSRIEPSFSSKLMSTINPDWPIWDKNVLTQLSIKRPKYRKEDKQKQLLETIETYGNLVKWYSNYMETQNARDVIQLFDSLFPDTKFTNVRKIDQALWSMGEKKTPLMAAQY
jgi:hypothetical protein